MSSPATFQRSETPPADHDVTPEELYANPQWGRCELVEGRVQQLNLAGHTHGEVSANAVARIGGFVRQRKLGRIYAVETGFVFPNHKTVRGPDVMFIAAARIPADLPRDGFLPVVPDFAVEVVSPEDPLKRVIEKAESYLAVGVKLVWVVDPATRGVRVFRPGTAVEEIGAAGSLHGDPVLPGFELPVSDLFGA